MKELFGLLFCLSVAFKISASQNVPTCEDCKQIKDCPALEKMDENVRQVWLNDKLCLLEADVLVDNSTTPTTTAKPPKEKTPPTENDYICCPSSIDLDNNNGTNSTDEYTPNLEEDTSSDGQHIQSFARKAMVNSECQAAMEYPPKSDTGCCGIDASVRVINSRRTRRQVVEVPGVDSAESDTNVTLEDRIAGGHETVIGQFPWLALLRIVFDIDGEDSAFSCGGSLISSTFVLTAGHCVRNADGSLKSVQVTFAEHDRTTFPNDCVESDRGQKCIKNVRTFGRKVFVHPRYEGSQLQNDVALIKLRNQVPYSDFIRPICLLSFDIDKNKLDDLKLTVAGWGRAGRKGASDVKLTTVVNLVPQATCADHYSNLNRRHLCAVGHSGQDTCQGDSGGPLMFFYKKRYYVTGIVSGKRADTFCGSRLPSLYTNVYHYLEWINTVVRKNT